MDRRMLDYRRRLRLMCTKELWALAVDSLPSWALELLERFRQETCEGMFRDGVIKWLSRYGKF